MTPLVVYSAAEDTRAAFSVAETARLLGVSEPTVRRAIRDGSLVAIKVGPASTRIPAWSIEALLAPERRVTVLAEGSVA